jgi:hypothetical protein
MDFDLRDTDSRSDERLGLDRNRGHRSDSDHDRDWDDWRQPAGRDRYSDAREPGRGPGESRHTDSCKHGYDRRDDARGLERDRESRESVFDPREVFTRDVHLPRGFEHEIVRDRDREYTLRGSESRTLATVGAFRVVSSRDLRDSRDRELEPRSGDLRHLREQALVESVRVPGTREHAVVLTKEGRSLLESHRDRARDGCQTFYAGLKRGRELEHDVQVYRAYERESHRLRDEHGRIERVILDYQLKSEYQFALRHLDADELLPAGLLLLHRWPRS